MIAGEKRRRTLTGGYRRWQLRALPRQFVEGDGGGVGGVEVGDRAGGRQLDQEVATLTRQAAQAGALGAQDDGGLAREVGGGEALLGLGGRAGRRTGLLQGLRARAGW
jgi:hypothetical protein